MPNSDAKVWVRMPASVRDALEKIAMKERRSINAQILVMLERAIKEYEASQN